MKFTLSAITAGLLLASSASAASIPAKRSTCTSENTRVRKEWRNLSSTEKQGYLGAFQCLMKLPAKTELEGTTSRFSDLQALHRLLTNTEFADVIHDVGQFFPWHRYYVHTLEHLMRTECDYTGPMSWWDEQQDADSGNFYQSSMWDADAFGGDGTGDDECVTDGAFANTTEHIGPGDENTEYCMKRRWINDMGVWTGNSSVIDRCNEYTTYSPWWECMFTFPHVGGHTSVGGLMADIKASPGDPTFFMHHGYIDRIWWKWQTEDSKRLLDISGPALNESANVEPVGGWPNTTMEYVLYSYNILPNITVGDVMDTKGGYLCYEYDY